MVIELFKHLFRVDQIFFLLLIAHIRFFIRFFIRGLFLVRLWFLYFMLGFYGYNLFGIYIIELITFFVIFSTIKAWRFWVRPQTASPNPLFLFLLVKIRFLAIGMTIRLRWELHTWLFLIFFYSHAFFFRRSVLFFTFHEPSIALFNPILLSQIIVFFFFFDFLTV